MWQSWMEWKMSLCKWHTFWMNPCLIYFIVILFHIKRKWLMRNLDTILPSLKKGEFPKISSKMKICKTFYETHIASCLKEIIQLPHSPTPKVLLHLWSKHCLMEIYRNIQTFAFKVLQESSSWASRNGAVQMFFMTLNRNMFVKSQRLLAVSRGHIVFNV